MSQSENKKRRKIYLIERVFQTKFVVTFLFLIILSSAISGLLLYKRANTELGYRYGEAHSRLKNTGEILLPNVLMGNIIAIVVIGIASVVLTIFISHKIAGPLYRFEKNTEQIAQGDLTVVTRLRQSDQIQGLADSFSKMTDELRTKLLGIRQNYEDLPILVDEMRRLGQKKSISSEELAHITARLSQISSNIEASLGNFKL